MPKADFVGDVASFDGTRIRYQTFGEGPPIVFGNGIGVGFRGLKLQIEALRKGFRVICWDHRGIFDSDRPGPGGMSVASQARDLLSVMDAVGVRDAAYAGWSMGVQVGLEAIRMARARFTRSFFLSGVAGLPGRAAVPLPFDRLVIAGLNRQAPRVVRSAWRAIGSERFFALAKRAGYVAESVDREVFMTMTRGVASHDPSVYLGTLSQVLQHDARDVLPALRVPVLFVGGDKDRMTPPRALAKLAKSAGGSVRTIEGGSHFALIERPGEVNELLWSFFSGC
ncbi:MAG: alpha/beta fold hydrolase [Deltaproteobacteria bacterium]|nr:alpha/beta fold hydrolase [Deltaproteobacteria bacterium]